MSLDAKFLFVNRIIIFLHKKPKKNVHTTLNNIEAVCTHFMFDQYVK